MKIEIVEFYPINIKSDYDFFLGSMHVFIEDFNMDIRGVLVKNVKGKLFFEIPSMKALDIQTDKMVKFPIIGFPDQKTKEDFLNQIIKLGSPVVKERLKELGFKIKCKPKKCLLVAEQIAVEDNKVG